MLFKTLIQHIEQAHTVLQTTATKAINTSLTIRNWLIGCYIVEFEQHGDDRAKYGDKVLINLENHFSTTDIKGLSERRFREYRLFYLTYPFLNTVITSLFDKDMIRRLPSAVSNSFSIRRLPSAKLKVSNKNNQNETIRVPADRLINNLSFSHLIELCKINDPLKRVFYEVEAIKGCWSVTELERQVNSLYFERSGLSKDKKKLSQLVNQQAQQLQPKDIVNSPFTFEFLNLNERALVNESELEQALLDNLQYFLLEMGHGFCLEARQKRILIDDEYFFVDLVFYHRILKCHVLVELKTDKFRHPYASQLNTYLNYFKNEVKRPDDNLPIGILLCTNKSSTLVEYATAGLNKNIFVKKYLVELPSKKELEEYIKKEISK